MKKPSPATEEGPLPGLSETNYKVLAGVTAVGVLAPALLLAQAFIPADFGKKAPPKKGDKGAKPATSKAAPAKKPAAAKMELPKLALPKREKAPAMESMPFSDIDWKPRWYFPPSKSGSLPYWSSPCQASP